MIQTNNEQCYIYSSKNIFLNHYFNKSINTAIKYLLSVANKDTLILDFGCGQGILKKKLPDYNIVGYDIQQKYSDVDDFRKVKPEVVFSHHVFEHLKERKLKKVIEVFKRMDLKYIIVAQPTENAISKIMRIVLRKKPSLEIGHYTDITTVYSSLGKYFRLVEERNIYMLTKVSKWEMKKK